MPNFVDFWKKNLWKNFLIQNSSFEFVNPTTVIILFSLYLEHFYKNELNEKQNKILQKYFYF